MNWFTFTDSVGLTFSVNLSLCCCIMFSSNGHEARLIEHSTEPDDDGGRTWDVYRKDDVDRLRKIVAVDAAPPECI